MILPDRPLAPISRRLPRSVVEAVKRTAARPVAWNLGMLATIFPTDKGSVVGDAHRYIRFYTRHLQDRRRRVAAVLEIGVGGYGDPAEGGESLRMWRSYFPNATIVGLDIAQKCFVPEPRIVLEKGDQSDPVCLARLCALGPFDLVIDDGSHIGAHQRAAFAGLFQNVKPGGLYVIEDLHTSYLAEFGGGRRGARGTGIDLVKDLLDDLHVGTRDVSSIYAYKNIVFIEKAELPAHRPRSVTLASGSQSDPGRSTRTG